MGRVWGDIPPLVEGGDVSLGDIQTLVLRSRLQGFMMHGIRGKAFWLLTERFLAINRNGLDYWREVLRLLA